MGAIFAERPTVPTNFDRYQRIAPLYDLLDLPFEYGRYRRIRPLLFEGISGRLLDAGVGTGRNFPFYPRDAKIIGIDVSPAMLARADRKRRSSSADIELRQMDVSRMDYPDRFFDAGVATFLFCVLSDDLQTPTLREMGRVIKIGGIIRLLEYTRPRGTVRRIMTHLWDPWVRWAYGANFDRRTDEHVSEAGLELIESRFVVDELIKLISARVAR